MALVLSGERPAAARFSVNPLRLFAAWIEKARLARSQRVALTNLLDLDDHRLADLGINRGDLFDAMHDSRRPTRLLAERRSRRARS